VAPLRLVEARADGFFEHVFGGRLERDEDTYDALLAVEDADEVAYVAGRDFAALDLNDDCARGFAFAFEVAYESVNARVFALLLVLRGARVCEREPPPLALGAAVFCDAFGGGGTV